MMFNLTSLFGLTLASLAVAIVGLFSHHYYPALVAVAITAILIWPVVSMMLGERRQEKERHAFANS
jgi:multisubunit Na+/H+ antiporter MnhG subunit